MPLDYRTPEPRLEYPNWFTVWSVEAWLVAVVLAVPAVLLWRRRSRDGARGFEVPSTAENI